MIKLHIKTRRFGTLLIALAVTLALGFILAARAPFISQVNAQSPLTSVIVQLAGDPVVVARARAQAAGQSFNADAYRQQVINEQQQFLTRLTAAGVPYTIASVTAPNGPVMPTIQFRFNYVYNGVTLNVPEAALPTIARLPGVTGVFPNSAVVAHLDRAVDYTTAPQVYGNPPRLTAFDTLNTGGLEGDGVNIAVIDTGVDWSHEMFGGDPTPPQYGAAPAIALAGTNKKVIYYLNLTAGPVGVGDDFGHGTHVAADAAGYRGFSPGPDGIPMTADDVPIHGVAPQARIMAYKALTAAGTGVNASIIMAIEDAIQPRTITGQPKPVAHVINMSLGSSAAATPDDPSSVAADNAALAGAIVVASAGNSGPGESTIGSPASGRRVITVGASTDPGSTPHSIDVLDGSRMDMRAYLLDGSPALTANITNNYVYCGLADTPDQIPDSVSGKIALIQRGSTASAQGQGTGMFSNKVALAAAKGAVAAVIYNNVDGDLSSATVRRSTIPAVAISKDNGEFLKSIIGSTAAGAISAQPIRINQALRTSPDMADFSSRGPVLGYGQVKPDVTAPGISIMSATVAVGGAETSASTMFDPTRYISASGTSFSGPITAGIAALIKQKHPDWTASQVRAALVNTATNLRYANGAAVADGANSINEQGGGLVSAAAAANIKALMGVGTPGPTGQPLPRSYGIFTQPSAGNPDFTPSYSYGAVPIANVIGTATITQQVTIFDVTNGAGAGIYQLNVASVRGVDGSTFNVSFTDAGGNAISAVTVPANGSASFNVKTVANGSSITVDGTQFQWYVTANRSDGGQNLRMPFYYRAVRPTITMNAPALNPANDTEVSGNPPVDINGSYSLGYSYTAAPAPAQYRVEEQKDNGAFTPLADVNQTTLALNNRGNGVYTYRVSGLFAVQYGLLQGPASAVQTVQVDRRLESDVTSLIQTAVSNVTLAAGVFEFDQTLTNISSNQTILPPLRFQITTIQSASGTVRAINADNGGNGVESPAVFDYSNTLGTDRALTVGEASGNRHLRFRDLSAELFEFTAVVKGQFPDPAYLSAGRAAGSKRFKVKLRFIADPTAGSVTIAGVE
jgi:subtilisin family serine protease